MGDTARADHSTFQSSVDFRSYKETELDQKIHIQRFSARTDQITSRLSDSVRSTVTVLAITISRRIFAYLAHSQPPEPLSSPRYLLFGDQRVYAEAARKETRERDPERPRDGQRRENAVRYIAVEKMPGAVCEAYLSQTASPV